MNKRSVEINSNADLKSKNARTVRIQFSKMFCASSRLQQLYA